MRKMKKMIASLSVAAMVALCGVSAYAEEETAEAATEAVMSEEGAQDGIAIITSDVELEEMDKQSLASYAQQSIEMIVSMTDEQMEEVIHPSTILTVPQESIVVSVQSWKDMKDELGAYQRVLSHDISVTDDNIMIASNCEFENAEGVVTTTLEREALTMESMTFTTGSKSLGETMTEAALNTVMGLGIVFIMLFFLSFLIGQFKHIHTLEEKMKKKNAPAAPAPAPAAAPAPAPVEEETADDGELVAVIAAAIAAAEGTSTDGFVVRSIKRSNRNKWQRA